MLERMILIMFVIYLVGIWRIIKIKVCTLMPVISQFWGSFIDNTNDRLEMALKKAIFHEDFADGLNFSEINASNLKKI